MTPESRNSPLLDNGPVSNFPLQRIDGVTDELLDMVIYILLVSKLQKASLVQFRRVRSGVQSFGIRKRV
jgi:hypothetical protein